MKCLAGHEGSEREGAKAQEKRDCGTHVQAHPCDAEAGSWQGRAGLLRQAGWGRLTPKARSEGADGRGNFGGMLHELERCLIIKLISFMSLTYSF